MLCRKRQASTGTEDSGRHQTQRFCDHTRYDCTSPVTLADAREGTRIGLAITQAFRNDEAVTL